MSEPAQGNITRLLINLTGGNTDAMGTLMSFVYQEPRTMATNYLRRERPDHTLQPIHMNRNHAR